MRTHKIKGNKHAEALVYDGVFGTQGVTINTRLRATDHGDFFRDLVAAIAPQAFTASGQGSRRMTPKELVAYCHEVTHLCRDVMGSDPSMALTVPGFDALEDRYRKRNGVDSADIIKLVGEEE